MARLFEQTKSDVENALQPMILAEDEINRARLRHPGESDPLFHSLGLLKPTHRLITKTEWMFRAHCRELLERVAHSEDTRPGTAAEVCCAMGEISLEHPLRTSAVGLYVRMWSAVGAPENPWTDSGEHYEALESDQIDDLEALTRRKLAVADRKLGTITCGGLHHGEVVQCKYAEDTRGLRT